MPNWRDSRLPEYDITACILVLADLGCDRQALSGETEAPLPFSLRLFFQHCGNGNSVQGTGQVELNEGAGRETIGSVRRDLRAIDRGIPNRQIETHEDTGRMTLITELTTKAKLANAVITKF